jgi:signal transduction histidine kinase
LRARLVWATVLWTAGLVVVTHLVILAILRHFPRASGGFIHVGGMSVVALGLLAAGLTQVRTGMSPLIRLRARLAGVRDGRQQRVEGDYPSEVAPLVSDLNALLDDRERSIVRAQSKAGDLAHGLKTPLAVLAQEADRAAAAGHHDLAATVHQQVERMRRQMDYHLIQARAVASGTHLASSCSVAGSVEGLVRTLRRLHADKELLVEAEVAAEHAVRARREDLDEMLGNLLDNACKWARSRVIVRSAAVGPSLVVLVEDDGPGLPEALRAVVGRRGVRADETAPGTGFGLAIVRDLAELYGGTLALSDSPLGGLRARIELPASVAP